MKFLAIKQALMILFALFSLTFSPLSLASDASSVVDSVNQRVMQALKANKAQYQSSPEQLTQLVEKDIIPFIDFTAFAKLILSKHWKTATATQRTQFEASFKGMLMRTYTRSMLEYTDADLSITRELPGHKPEYAKVYGKFSLGNGQPDVPVIFEMRNDGTNWKAYNVTVKAFSLVENFRSSFGKEINQYGLDGLIDRLNKGQVTE
jgi:phospholipid transport system substrate-binding protein